jgi:ubiquinone/menaquinone biosynthesis C-methylase UbiE
VKRAAREREAERFKAFEAAGWDAKAGTYDRLTGRVTARVVDPLLDAAAVGKGARVLDLATGTGTIAAAAAARGAVPVGVDLAGGMITAARARHPHLDFQQADAEQLPFGEAAFDGVVAGFVFNHLPHPERAAAECARVLVDGGRLAVAVWDEPERSRFLGLISEAVAAAGLESELPAGPDPYRFAREAELRKLLTESGFVAVATRSIEFAHSVSGVDEFLEGFLGGSVRTAKALEDRSARERARVRGALEAIVAPYRTDRGLELPVVIKLAAGRKP